jgi:serine/threonine-protein kinase
VNDDQTIGRYRIVGRIGRGGMGVLYKGIDPALDREVAIKVMSNSFEGDVDSGARARFFREARAAAKLQHRNIVTVFEFAEEEGTPYIVMEFLRGQSLAARLGAGPPLTLEEKLDIVAELCAGLQFAHENGVVHRDVKPGNVWLLDDGTVKLLDFGIAKISSSTLTKQGDVMGSASYMAPEQVSGKSVDGRADIFSAGVVLYELLAGRTPFQGESPTATILKIVHENPVPIASVAIGIPPSLGAAVEEALQKDPAKRYQSAGDFGADLQLVRMSLHSAGETLFSGDADFGEVLSQTLPGSLKQDLPLGHGTAPAQSATPSSPRDSERRRWLWVAGGSTVLVLVAGLGWFGTRRSASGRVTAQQLAPEVLPAGGSATDKALSHAPAPPVGVLKIDSTPDGAAIDLDGHATGQVTPATIAVEGVLPSRIRLTKEGFQPFDERLTVTKLEKETLRYRLVATEPATIKVTVTGSYPFAITDGRRIVSAAATSHELSIQPARSLRLQAPAHLLDYPFKVDASVGRSMQVRAPELGGLTIRSAMETCQVSANGHDLGFPPINNQAVAAGTYQLQLNCPDGQRVRGTSVTVVAGETRIARIP